MTLHTTTAHYV